jgi:4'-phosphopantetheinyl transferase
LDRAEPVVRRLLKTLAPDERSRAERFYFQVDRDHFIVARGILRAILSRYLETEPEQLRFYYASHGKPELAKEFDRHGVRFNISHSQGLALFAITRDREVGVDLEAIRPGIAGEKIAERFFSPREVRVLRAPPGDLQDEAFFNCWTRKEAYIKAKGEGLSMPLDTFDVSLVPGEPAALLNTKADPQEASRWSLRELFPAPGFAAAVAVEGKDWQLRCWEWSE